MAERLKSWLRNLIVTLLAEELNRVKRDAADRAVERTKYYLAAMQAMDVNFCGTGKIIILCRVGKQDFVKIIETPLNTNLTDYRRMVAELEDRYGAKLHHSDLPRGIGRNLYPI